ncbi:MAG: AtpZ/AtpI family protein [Proteobacteria bacterium]|nr:AtpZ/AtpI family protein [Pseudomonadota bacterium]
MLKQAGRFAAVGLEMGVAVGIGILGGWYLDKEFGTKPVFFWIGFTVGIGAAAKAIIDIARKASKDLTDNGNSSPK